jgi:hypothetical protein
MSAALGLFGEGVATAASLRPVPVAVPLSLLDAAAERIALDSGRNVAQVRLELLHPPAADDGEQGVFRCLCGRSLGRKAHRKPCAGCGR